MEEMTPVANTMYEAGTSSQAVREAEEREEESQEVTINDSLQASTAHLKNIQVQSKINREEKGIVQLQALHMAQINDELQEKLQHYHLALALEKSKVDAE